MTTGHDNLPAIVRGALGDTLSAGSHIRVGLSGGLDSVVLLHVLAQLRAGVPFELSAIHVHHGLSANADEWAAFCENLCGQWDVACEVVRLQLPEASGKGVERLAREGRYEAYTAVSGDILCLAHHQNDCAETLLLNLFRGAGPIGLAGLPAQRMLGRKILIRPFIAMPRSDLQAWATANRLLWIEDESNADVRFRRNFIRHRVLPVIVEAYPGATEVLSRTAAHLGEQAELLDRLAELEARACRDSAGCLSVARLQQLPEPAIRNILRHALFKAGLRIPGASRLTTLSTQLMSARADSEVLVRMGAAGVHVWRDQIWIDRAMNCPVPPAVDVGSMAADWPDGTLTVHGLTDGHDLRIQSLGHGQRFQPAGRCRDAVSELLRAQGVPPWVRPRLPGLWLRGQLVWVAGLGCAEDAVGVLDNDQICWTLHVPERL